MSEHRESPGFSRAGAVKTYGDYSQKVIARARLLHARGYGGREIKRHLADEGHKVPEATIESWIYNNVRAKG